MCSSIQTLTRTGASSCPRRIAWWGGLPSGPTAIQVRDLPLRGARVALAVVGGFEKFQRNYSVARWISRRSPRWSLFLSALPCTRAEMSGWSSGCGCSFLEKNRKSARNPKRQRFACVRVCRFSLAPVMGNRGGACPYAAPGQRRGSASHYRKKADRKQWRQTGALLTNVTEEKRLRKWKRVCVAAWVPIEVNLNGAS